MIERLEPRVVLNGTPVAVADPWYSTPVSTTLNVTTQGTTLLANDWDPEGSSISASLVSGPSHGSLSNFQSNGTFSYTPTSGYRGFDSFTYRVNDGSANSNTVEALFPNVLWNCWTPVLIFQSYGIGEGERPAPADPPATTEGPLFRFYWFVPVY